MQYAGIQVGFEYLMNNFIIRTSSQNKTSQLSFLMIYNKYSKIALWANLYKDESNLFENQFTVYS